MPGPCSYIYLDESGNFDFSITGTRYLVLACVTFPHVPNDLYHELVALRYSFIEKGWDLQEFHATTDKQEVRDAVFEVIGRHLSLLTIDSVVVEKAKTYPHLQDLVRFYAEMTYQLLQYAIPQCDSDQLVVFLDSVPERKKRSPVIKAVKGTMSRLSTGQTYSLHHHDSASNVGIQVADYCTWAIYRKWSRADSRSFDLIKKAVRRELDIFSGSNHRFY